MASLIMNDFVCAYNRVSKFTYNNLIELETMPADLLED